jgi:PIN domain nuclease of toxin-antitoxin system
MKVLLDTHVLLWWLEDPALLSKQVRTSIAAGDNAVYVSAAVVWELTIKKALGRLVLPNDLQAVIAANNFSALSISVAHALAVEALPNHHKDPFDRLLIAQALSDGLVLATRDSNIMKYGAPVMVA